MTDYKIENKIEKNIPVTSRSKYPFPEMNVGDSFLVPADSSGARVNERATSPIVSGAARAWGHTRGRKFSVRKQPCGGYRVWRVK